MKEARSFVFPLVGGHDGEPAPHGRRFPCRGERGHAISRCEANDTDQPQEEDNKKGKEGK